MHLIARTWLTHSTGLRCLAWSPAPWSSSSPGLRSTVSSWLRVIRLHGLHDRCTKLWSGGAQGCRAGGNGDHIGSSQTKNQTRAKKKILPCKLRKSGCSHHLGFLDQQGWQTRNDNFLKSSVNLQLIALYYYVSRMEGALKNDQEHQTINQECTKCSAKISICWSAPHDGSLSGAEDVRILRAPPPKTSTLPQLDEPQHNSRCTQTEKAQAPKAALLLFKTQLKQELSSSAKATTSDNRMRRRKDVE